MTKRVEGLRLALERIERWFGEFPETGDKWDDGTPVSYGAAFGSNGERDFMRAIAREALAADRAEAGELPELPAIQRYNSEIHPTEDGAYVGYDDHVWAMRTYGQQCARAASCGGGDRVSCAACNGAGGHRWHEPDGSEGGERCEVCEGFGYTTPPTPSAGVEVTEDMVERAVEEIRKAKHTCFDRWTDADAMHAALTAALEGGKS